MSDTLLRDGEPILVRTLRPPCMYVGNKRLHRDGSPKMAKAQGCQNTPENQRPIIFTPTYDCAIFGKCAPFSAKIEDDADRTRPCYECRRYLAPQPVGFS